MSTGDGRRPGDDEVVDEYRQALVQAIAGRDRREQRVRRVARLGAVVAAGIVGLGGMGVASTAVLPDADLFPFAVQAPSRNSSGEEKQVSERLFRSYAAEQGPTLRIPLGDRQGRVASVFSYLSHSDDVCSVVAIPSRDDGAIVVEDVAGGRWHCFPHQDLKRTLVHRPILFMYGVRDKPRFIAGLARADVVRISVRSSSGPLFPLVSRRWRLKSGDAVRVWTASSSGSLFDVIADDLTGRGYLPLSDFEVTAQLADGTEVRGRMR